MFELGFLLAFGESQHDLPEKIPDDPDAAAHTLSHEFFKIRPGILHLDHGPQLVLGVARFLSRVGEDAKFLVGGFLRCIESLEGFGEGARRSAAEDSQVAEIGEAWDVGEALE